MKTVTRDGWGVSCTTGDTIEGAELHVYKFHEKDGREFGLMQKGDGYGRRFPSSEAAFRWAYEHGYEQAFVTPWCRKCRVRHEFMGRKSGFCDVHKEFVS